MHSTQLPMKKCMPKLMRACQFLHGHLASLFLFHPIPEPEFQLLILSDNNPIHKCHKGEWIEVQACHITSIRHR